MKIEIHQLDRHLAGLKIASPSRHRRLVASLVERGQQTPVTVVPAEGEERFVLVDGHARVRALEDLGRDLVEALVWPVTESEALVLSHKASRRRPSPLEEGWLLAELSDGAGWSRRELSFRFERSPSWVSRRLGLVTALPVSVQEAVRKGQVSPQAAMKSLLPLARANAGHCEMLVASLGSARLSVREAAELYRAWRQADAEGRERIVTHPRLCLETVGTPIAASSSTGIEQAARDARVLTRVATRLERRLLDGLVDELDGRLHHGLNCEIGAASKTVGRLVALLSIDKESHARLRDTDRDSPIAS